MSDAKNVHQIALDEVAEQIEDAQNQLNWLRTKRVGLMVEARQSGLTYVQIAEALGVTKAYVHQVVKKAGTQQ